MNLFRAFQFVIILAVPVSGQTILTQKEFNQQKSSLKSEYEKLDMKSQLTLAEPIIQAIYSKITTFPDSAVILQLHIYCNENGKPDYIVYQLLGHFGEMEAELSPTEVRSAFENMKLAGLTRKTLLSLALRAKKEPLPKPRASGANRYTLTSLEDLRTHPYPDSIQKINLSELELDRLPEEIYRFRKIRELDLSKNKLRIVTLNFKKLPDLNRVALSSNRLKKLRLKGRPVLSDLNLQGALFRHLPGSIRKANQLNSLWLGFSSNLNLNRRDFRKIKGITDLNLYACSLKTLSPSIEVLKNLQTLDLYHNQLEEIPSTVGKLKGLSTLALSNNRLKNLPNEINNLHNLKKLYAHHNHLSTLPADMGAMNNLTMLDLGYNQFTTYPTTINQIRSLKELDISSNLISVFPEPMLELSNLRVIRINNNPFLATPAPGSSENQKTLSPEVTAGLKQLAAKNRQVVH